MKTNKKPTTLSLVQALRHDVNEMKESMATKDDLKYFATKDDLKNFATKDDLKNFATKDDIKNMATKDDVKFLVSYVDDMKGTIITDFEVMRRDVDGLKNRLEGVVQSVLKNSEDIQRLEQTVATKSDIQTILLSIDSFTKKVSVVENKGWVHDHRLNELEPRMDNVEKRLTGLESSQ